MILELANPGLEPENPHASVCSSRATELTQATLNLAPDLGNSALDETPNSEVNTNRRGYDLGRQQNANSGHSVGRTQDNADAKRNPLGRAYTKPSSTSGSFLLEMQRLDSFPPVRIKREAKSRVSLLLAMISVNLPERTKL